MNGLDKALENYIESLKPVSSDNTLSAYRRDAETFVSYFVSADKSEPDDITEEDIAEYFADQADNMSAASVTRRLSVVKGFYKYMLNAGILTENRAADVKASGFERKTPDILSRTEVEKLLAQPDITDPKGIRDRAMLEVMYATGMRVTELLDLRISDYVPRTKTIICSSAKRPRSFELYPIAAKCLGDYLKNSRQSFIKQSSDCVYIFINFNGERMTRQGFWKLLKYYAEASGISNQISPHTLRHSFATHLLENGAEPRDVQELLGNRDGAAVKEYLNYIKSKAMGKAIKHHPRA